MILHQDCFLNLVEGGPDVVMALLRHVHKNVESGSASITDVRVLASTEDCPSRAFVTWSFRSVKLLKSESVPDLAGDDPVNSAYNTYSKLVRLGKQLTEADDLTHVRTLVVFAPGCFATFSCSPCLHITHHVALLPYRPTSALLLTFYNNDTQASFLLLTWCGHSVRLRSCQISPSTWSCLTRQWRWIWKATVCGQCNRLLFISCDAVGHNITSRFGKCCTEASINQQRTQHRLERGSDILLIHATPDTHA